VALLSLKNIFTYIFPVFIFFSTAHAQLPEYYSQKILLEDQIDRLNKYRELLHPSEIEYINGKLHYPYANKFVHPFFKDNLWKSGEVWIGTEKYNLGAVKYDIVSDYLVLLYFQKSTAYQIYFNREVLKQFSIDDHYFKYLDNPGNLSEKKIEPGYYELLYDGKTKFFVRWEKTKALFESQNDLGYTQKVQYFLYKEGEFFKIIRNVNLFKALEDHKHEIRAYIRKNRVSIKTDNPSSVISLLEYYDNL